MRFGIRLNKPVDVLCGGFRLPSRLRSRQALRPGTRKDVSASLRLDDVIYDLRGPIHKRAKGAIWLRTHVTKFDAQAKPSQHKPRMCKNTSPPISPSTTPQWPGRCSASTTTIQPRRAVPDCHEPAGGRTIEQ